MKLTTLALAALVAVAGPALAQTPAAKDTVKNDRKAGNKNAVKADKEKLRADRNAARTDKKAAKPIQKFQKVDP